MMVACASLLSVTLYSLCHMVLHQYMICCQMIVERIE